jgi:hypothetical protein
MIEEVPQKYQDMLKRKIRTGELCNPEEIYKAMRYEEQDFVINSIKERYLSGF